MARDAGRPGPPDGQAPFTTQDFQLVLLRRMADHNPVMVEDARRQLGASTGDMREANRRWQAKVRGPRGRGLPGGPEGSAALYRSVLGPPESRTARQVAGTDCEALLWPVPLWPDLCFEVLLAPDGRAWNAWLVRDPSAPRRLPYTAAELAPWAWTVDEVARAFPPARPLQGTAPTRWGLAFDAPPGPGTDRPAAYGTADGSGGEADGEARFPTSGDGDDSPADEPRRWVAEFTWGLLQRFRQDG